MLIKCFRNYYFSKAPKQHFMFTNNMLKNKLNIHDAKKLQEIEYL